MERPDAGLTMFLEMALTVEGQIPSFSRSRGGPTTLDDTMGRSLRFEAEDRAASESAAGVQTVDDPWGASAPVVGSEGFAGRTMIQRGRVAIVDEGRSERDCACQRTGPLLTSQHEQQHDRTTTPVGQAGCQAAIHGRRGATDVTDVTDVTDITDITDIADRGDGIVETLNLLDCVLESLDQGVLLLDAGDHIRIWNRRAVEFLGLLEALLYDGAPFGDVLAHLATIDGPGQVEPSATAWSKTVNSGARPTVHERQRPDGTVLEIRASPIANRGALWTMLSVTVRRNELLAAQDGEARYRLLAENTTDVIIGSDTFLNRYYVSPSIKGMLGFEPHEVMSHGSLSVHPDDVDDYRSVLTQVTSGSRQHAMGHARYRHKDGHYIWGEFLINAVGGRDGEPAIGCVGSIRDVSDRKAGELALRLSEERLTLALDSGSDGLWDYDIANRRVHLSGRWLHGLGLDPQGVILGFDDWTALFHPEDRGELLGGLDGLVRNTDAVLDCECRMQVGPDSHGWALTRGKVVMRDRGLRALRVIGTHIDITRRKEAERLVAHMALHDALTGLPNRALFREHLARELQSFKHYGTSFAVLACDLDQFKAVNDTLGHLAGDVLLCEVAKRIVAAIRPSDMVARLGGDEFAVVLGRMDLDRDDAGSVASRIIEAVSRPIDVESSALVVGISIGIALASGATEEADQLFKQADIAMYRAKNAGRNTHRTFVAGMDTEISERIELERELRIAVERSDLNLAYQPVFSIPDGQLIGCEALLRWKRVGGEPVSPAVFVPIAEETGLILPIGAWVLREATREAAGWPDPVRVAVNVSSIQFGQPGLEEIIFDALAAAPLAPHRLEIEITESVLLRDVEPTIATLRRLQAAGVRIALDDFGTGYSSLSYLRRFPFDKIKIDKAFVADIDDPGTAAIVRAVAGLGARVGADVTAEGVETTDQLRLVAEEGCTEVQGYLLGRPTTPDVIGHRIRSELVRSSLSPG